MEIEKTKREWIVNKGVLLTVCAGVENGAVTEVRMILPDGRGTESTTLSEAVATELVAKLIQTLAEVDAAKVRTVTP